MELPRTGVPGVAEGSLVELLKAVYGLGDAPVQWLSSFTKYAKGLGFKQSAFDSCVFYLRKEGVLHGVMGLTVDDIIGGGDEMFDGGLPKPQSQIPCWGLALRRPKV